MLTIKQATVHDTQNASALVASYGREYALIVDEGRIFIKRTQDTSYERLPAWKKRNDIKAIEAFAEVLPTYTRTQGAA